MHRGSSRLLVCSLALACATAASAAGSGRTQYKWRDATGALHFADSLPAEAARYGYEVVNAQGVVVRRVERAKTAEEQAAAKAELAKAQTQREEAEALARADAQMLSAYPTEEDLARSQQQRLELLDQHVESARIGLRSLEQALADQLAHAAEIERIGKNLPEAQARQIAETRKQIDAQRSVLARRESERADATAKFEAEVAHYRELKTRIAQQKQSR